MLKKSYSSTEAPESIDLKRFHFKVSHHCRGLIDSRLLWGLPRADAVAALRRSLGHTSTWSMFSSPQISRLVLSLVTFFVGLLRRVAPWGHQQSLEAGEFGASVNASVGEDESQDESKK